MQKYSFKNLIACFTLGMLPIALFIVILSLLNITPIYFNESPHYGVQGFFLGLIIAPFFGLVVGIVSYLLLTLGSFIYNTLIYRLFYKKQS